MEYLINRLDICYNNLLLTKRSEQKEKILNKILLILRYCKIATDLVNYLYLIDKDNFYKFMKVFDKQCLILMIYDLQAIGEAINIPDGTTLEFYNNSFHIDYNIVEDSPKGSVDSSNLKWGDTN